MALLSLIAKLGIDASGFNQGLKQAEGSATSFGKNVGASIKSSLAGAFTVGTIYKLGKTAIETASRIQDLSEQFDISTDAVQRIDFALKQGGLAFEDFGAAMDKFGAIRKKAATGDEESITTLGQFGVTLDEIKDPLQTNLDLILKLSDALKGIIITPAQRADLREIFGKSSGRLLTTMQGGFGRAPYQNNDEDIKRVEGFGDKLSAMMQGGKNILTMMMSDLIESPWKFITGQSLAKRMHQSGGASGSWGSPPAPLGDGLHIFNQGEGFNDLFRPGPPAPAKIGSGFAIAGDALANVGGYVGGAGGGGGGAIDILKESLKVQTASKDYLRDMTQNSATF